MVHRLFQTGYEQLQSNVFGNFCSQIYYIGLFPKASESMPRTVESGRYSVGNSFTFSGGEKKINSVFFGWPFEMQRLLKPQNQRAPSASEMAADLHICVLGWFGQL